MDKKDKLLIIYCVIMVMLIIVILKSMSLNSFLTPFSGGDKYTPWETKELQSILQPDSYVISGTIASKNFDERDNRYIVPKTSFAKLISWLFKWRVKFTFLASLIGVILFIGYKNMYKKKKYPLWVKAFFILLHIYFFYVAFWGNLCVRWWGYG